MRRRIALLPVLVFLGSCADPFGTQVLDRVQSEDLWREEILVRNYLSDLYTRFPWSGFPNAEAAGAGWTGEIRGNTPNPTSTDDEEGGYFDYEYIRDLNVFLQEIEQAQVPEATREQMKGEVKTIRAAVYWEMQRRYGGVPLVDVVLDPFDIEGIDESYLRRATEEEIADFIDRELAEAVELLPEDHSSTGQINRWTAYAYKAHANLWSASVASFPAPLANQSDLIGIPADRADEFYEKAAAAAGAVINSGRFSLYDRHLPDHVENYRRIFLDDAANPEVIFERHYDGINVPGDYTTTNIFVSFASGPGGSHVNYTRLLEFEDLDGAFTDPAFGPDHRYDDGVEPWLHKDPRVRALTWFQGEHYGGRPLEIWEGIDPSPAGTADPTALRSDPTPGTRYPDSGGVLEVGRDSRRILSEQVTLSGLHLKKYIQDLETIGEPWAREEDKNQIQIRLAEMYLVKAEAELELGNLIAAAEALNMTRERAGLPPVEEVGGISRDRVRTEFVSELAMEGGHRYWNYRRWRTAEDQLNNRLFCGLRTIYHYEEDAYYFLPSTTTAEGCEPSTRQFLPQHYYNPMTNERRANNPLLEENPGY